MTSKDEAVQLAAILALCNVANSDPKAAAAIRDADGLKPLVNFLGSANVKIQIASASTLLGCSRNEMNKTVLRCDAVAVPTSPAGRMHCQPPLSNLSLALVSPR